MAITGAHDAAAMAVLAPLVKDGLIYPTLIGDGRRIRSKAESAGVSISSYPVIDVKDEHDACAAAAELAVRGETDILYRGKVPAYDMLKVLCTRATGFRQTQDLLTHVAVFEMDGMNRLVFVSDGGVVVAPDLDMKIRILNQAVQIARQFGVTRPKVALLAAVETVASYLPVAMEGAAIAKMGDRGQLGNAIVDGPLSLDVALSPESAEVKRVNSLVAGSADVLIVPQIEAGNVMYKAVMTFTNAKMGGIVVGGKTPVIIPGLFDRSETRIYSVLLAIWLNHTMK